MTILKKVFKPVFSKITGHCIGAVGIGIIMATLAAFAIVNWQGMGDNPAVTATYTIRLPQDEQMLKRLSDEILEGTDVGAETENLSNIAPAAGSDAIPAE